MAETKRSQKIKEAFKQALKYHKEETYVFLKEMFGEKEEYSLKEQVSALKMVRREIDYRHQEINIRLVKNFGYSYDSCHDSVDYFKVVNEIDAENQALKESGFRNYINFLKSYRPFSYEERESLDLARWDQLKALLKARQ